MFSFRLLIACTNYKEASTIGFFTGLGYFIISLFWIMEPFLIPGSNNQWLAPFALFALSGGLSLFWLFAYGISISISSKYGLVFSTVFTLSAAEYLRSIVFSGFPWSLIGYTWSNHPILQLSSVIGPHGLTLLTLIIAGTPFFSIRPKALRVVLPILLLCGSWVYGYMVVEKPDVYESTKVVRLIQPNAPQHEKWDQELIPIFWERQLEFTRAAAVKPLDLIIWPETSISVLLNNANEVLEVISSNASAVPVIVGINDLVDDGIRNSMAVIGENGIVLDKFHKKKLVPFGEYMPFGEWLVSRGINSLAAIDEAGYRAGTGERVLKIPGLVTVIPLICYELIFPSNVRSQIRPNMIIQITNDAWFGSYSGPYQHLAQAKFRAVEQALPVIRVANTGISAVIDSKGRIIAQTKLNEAAFLDASIPHSGSKTLYAKFSDWPFLSFIFIFTFISVLLRKKRITD